MKKCLFLFVFIFSLSFFSTPKAEALVQWVTAIPVSVTGSVAYEEIDRGDELQTVTLTGEVSRSTGTQAFEVQLPLKVIKKFLNREVTGMVSTREIQAILEKTDASGTARRSGGAILTAIDIHDLADVSFAAHIQMDFLYTVFLDDDETDFDDKVTFDARDEESFVYAEDTGPNEVIRSGTRTLSASVDLSTLDSTPEIRFSNNLGVSSVGEQTSFIMKKDELWEAPYNVSAFIPETVGEVKEVHVEGCTKTVRFNMSLSSNPENLLYRLAQVKVVLKRIERVSADQVNLQIDFEVEYPREAGVFYKSMTFNVDRVSFADCSMIGSPGGEPMTPAEPLAPEVHEETRGSFDPGPRVLIPQASDEATSDEGTFKVDDQPMAQFAGGGGFGCSFSGVTTAGSADLALAFLALTPLFGLLRKKKK